jgi:hypothetical protein
VAEPKKSPDDAHLEESRRLLEEMDALLRRVRNLMDDHAKPTRPKLIEKADDSKT